MCPLLCPECRSPIALPDCCSHATCLACGLMFEEFPLIDGEEALTERSNAASSFRTHVPSGTLGRWRRLRFLQWDIDNELFRRARVQTHFHRLKAELAIPISEDAILTLFTRIIPVARAKRLHISLEALTSVLFYTQAKAYGLAIDFDTFITHAGFTKRRLFRLLSRLTNAGLCLPQTRHIINSRRQTALGILDNIRTRFDLPPLIFNTACNILAHRELSAIPRIGAMAALLVSVHRCKAAGLLTNRKLPLRPIFEALHVAPSTAYNIGHVRKLLPPRGFVGHPPTHDSISATG